MAQKNLNDKLVGIRSNYGTESDNTNFLNFYVEMGLITLYLHQELLNKIVWLKERIDL